jgi:hypothetical protein
MLSGPFADYALAKPFANCAQGKPKWERTPHPRVFCKCCI